MEVKSTKQPVEGQWSTGLFDCFDDVNNCLCTCFCPCVTSGQLAEIIDKGTISSCVAGSIFCALGAHGCAWLMGGAYRRKFRTLFSLPEEPCSDFLVHFFCCACADCQEYRELNNRGIDPAKGWKGNVDEWKYEGLKPPFAEQGMNR